MNLKVKVCLVSSITAQGIFIPWFRIMKISPAFEAIMGILCLFLIGYLILFLAPFIFAIAQIISIISYTFILIKYKTLLIDRKWLVVLTLLLLPNIILSKDVYTIYHSIYTLDWWGNADYFKMSF